MTSFYSAEGGPIWIKFRRLVQNDITLQGAATWWIHCHDPRATCHIAGCKNSIRYIENRFSLYIFWFLMQFRLWRAAAFVSSAIHLLCLRPRTGGGIKRSSASVVRPSDVAYIGSNSKTKRPRKTKLCTGYPRSHATPTPTLRSKGQKSRSRGQLVQRT